MENNSKVNMYMIIEIIKNYYNNQMIKPIKIIKNIIISIKKDQSKNKYKETTDQIHLLKITSH